MSATARRRGRPTRPRGLVPSRRSRAWVLLKTMTTQNVAWPTITVARPSVTPSADVKVAFSAIPVTMPGNVIGSTTRKLTTVAAEEPVPLHGEGGHGAEDQRDRRGAEARPPPSWPSDVHIPSLFHATTHHCSRETARREGEGARRVERVHEHQSSGRRGTAAPKRSTPEPRRRAPPDSIRRSPARRCGASPAGTGRSRPAE